VQESPLEAHPEVRQFGKEHRDQVDEPLAPGECIAKLLACGQGRGSRCKDAQLREEIGADLQHSAWVSKLVNFVEDDHRRCAAAKEQLRITDHFLDCGEIAIDEGQAFGPEALCQCGFPCPAHSGKPDDGCLAPRRFDPPTPKRTLNHKTILYIKCGY